MFLPSGVILASATTFAEVASTTKKENTVNISSAEKMKMRGKTMKNNNAITWARLQQKQTIWQKLKAELRRQSRTPAAMIDYLMLAIVLASCVAIALTR